MWAELIVWVEDLHDLEMRAEWIDRNVRFSIILCMFTCDPAKLSATFNRVKTMSVWPPTRVLIICKVGI